MTRKSVAGMSNASIDVSAAIDSDNIGDCSVQSDRSLRVAVIDDHALTLQGPKTLLSAEPDFELVGCYQTMSGLLAGVGTDGCLDVIVLDLRLADGSDSAQSVFSPELAIDHMFILSSAEGPYLIRKAVRTGVMGVVQKSETPETVVSVVRLATLNKGTLTTEWTSVVDSDPLLDPVGLPECRRETLELYASGELTKRVTSMTGLAPNIVLGYLGRIRAKYAAAGWAEGSLNKLEMYRLA